MPVKTPWLGAWLILELVRHPSSLWSGNAVERRRRNFTTGPSPTGPQVLHQRDQRRIHGPSPCSIASPITHVASLAQSMVSAPMVRASPAAWSQNLWSCRSNSFECMRYDRQVRFGLPHPEHTPSRRRIDQEGFDCVE